ncbi:MAG: segregation/condensation protein A [Polyangiaceae bacterium]|nr:segregation/condensation protein A [Polyangiaceae bacterium]
MSKAKATAISSASARRTRTSASAAASVAAQKPAPEAAPHPETDQLNDSVYRVQLPSFEGPLDLLLHLIQQHELDILDIPVSFITQKYLEYLALMQSLTIDVASEYLVMAATLTHIKSKMLLPVVPAGQDGDGLPEEEVDPRAELVRRLLEYQKYKTAAAEIFERGTLGKDVFGRGIAEPVPEGPAPFAPVGVFALFDAFEKLLKRTNVKVDHEVVFDRITITDRIVELTERLSERRRCTFEDLILNDPTRQGAPLTRFDIVITFLAILEMARMKLLRVYQSDPLAPIHLEMTMSSEPKDDGDDAQGASGRADGLSEEAEPDVELGQTDGEPEQLRLFEDDDVEHGAEEAAAPVSGDSEVEDGN